MQAKGGGSYPKTAQGGRAFQERLRRAPEGGGRRAGIGYPPGMTTLEIAEGKLVLTVHGFDVVLALKHRLEIPLTHVIDAEVGVAPEARERLRQSLKLPGTHLPGIITAGSYLEHGRWMFWDVHGGGDNGHAVTIHIDHEKYERLVVDVEDPVGTVAKIKHVAAAVARRATPPA